MDSRQRNSKKATRPMTASRCPVAAMIAGNLLQQPERTGPARMEMRNRTLSTMPLKRMGPSDMTAMRNRPLTRGVENDLANM